MKPPTPELRKLVDQLLDERGMTKVETSRLEDLMRDKDGLRYYAELVTQESMMADALEGITGVEKPRVTLSFPVKVLLAAAAAAMFFALGFFSRQPGDSSGITTARAADPAPSHAGTLPARITGLMGVEWAEGGEPDLMANHGTARQLAIRTGLVEVTYASGVRVTLEGPAEFSVVDPTAGRLSNGKLVAYVPPGAEGFHVDYAKGRVVDLGTEFAMDVKADGRAELGVFDGRIQLHLPGQDVRQLQVNQALMHDDSAEEPLVSIPLDRDKFVRRLPARDFRWEATGDASRKVEFDVTHLIWKPASYRALFKGIHGAGRVEIRDVELCLDGKTVDSWDGAGTTGLHVQNVRSNLVSLDVSSADFRRGRWTVKADLRLLDGTKGPVSGILQFEEGLVSAATAEDFIGTWRYYFNGVEHKRRFMPDGTIRFYKNGILATENFVNGRWKVENGVLYQSAPEIGLVEEHVLRNAGTLIFVNQPYDNAVKVPDP